VNLVVNAGDAMPNGGTLTIKTAPADLDDHFSEPRPGMAAVLYAELTASDMARTGSCSRSRAPPGGQAPNHPFLRGSSSPLGVASGPGVEGAGCAVLLPALARLTRPLALVEVCVATGLTLLPDIYSYDYGGHRLMGTGPDAPPSSAVPVGLCRCPSSP
jgi:hypothetical protein